MTNQGATAGAPKSPPNPNSAMDTLATARSDALVVAFVGHIGAGLDDVCAKLYDEFLQASYLPVVIKVSDHIAELAVKTGFEGSERFTAARKIEKTIARQQAGTWLRQQRGDDITASLAVRAIRDKRKSPEVSGKTPVFLVDSLKHPREVELLRRLYGNSFYLVSVVCRLETRRKNVRRTFVADHPDDAEIDKLLARDEADTETLGQQVRKTLHLGDFFVDNDHSGDEDPDPLAQDLARFVDAVLERTVVRPRRDERGMHAAWSASLRSTCLSRQVGAAILDRAGLVVATGTNDVPRAGGGLYDDEADDQRCFNEGGFCRNDSTKREIYAEIFEQLMGQSVLGEHATPAEVRACIEATTVKDLVEFSRAVHAEMDAIVSLARSAGGSTQDASLYCTTYPCHSCARHIVASGIREVVYIEPYTKSRAVRLHGDAIVETTRLGAKKLDESNDEKAKRKVRFRLFSGVAPRRFSALFEKRGDLKNDDGRLVQLGARPVHRDAILTKSFSQLEDLIAQLADDVYNLPAEDGGGT